MYAYNILQFVIHVSDKLFYLFHIAWYWRYLYHILASFSILWPMQCLAVRMLGAPPALAASGSDAINGCWVFGPFSSQKSSSLAGSVSVQSGNERECVLSIQQTSKAFYLMLSPAWHVFVLAILRCALVPTRYWALTWGPPLPSYSGTPAYVESLWNHTDFRQEAVGLLRFVRCSGWAFSQRDRRRKQQFAAWEA